MTCKLCNGRCALLGMLGNLKWFRCIQCGMEWNRRVRGEKQMTGELYANETHRSNRTLALPALPQRDHAANQSDVSMSEVPPGVHVRLGAYDVDAIHRGAIDTMRGLLIGSILGGLAWAGIIAAGVWLIAQL